MSFKKKQTPKEIEETVINHTPEQIRKKLKLLLDAYYWKCDNLGDALWLCHNLDVPHRLQSGFNCGLVALRMAAEFLAPSLSEVLVSPTLSTSFRAFSSTTLGGDGDLDAEVHVTPLLLLAQELQFTNEGEIFSSDDLAVLGERHYGLKVEVLRPLSSCDVIKHLLSGYPFLIPLLAGQSITTHATYFSKNWYDADKNYAPCVANGHRPHWALVRGFVYKLPDEASASSAHLHFSAKEEFLELDKETTSWFHTTKSLQEHTMTCTRAIPPPHIDDAHLYLICQHGKSRNVALWSFAALAQSNDSLATPDAARRECGRWRIPADLAALRGSVVLLFPRARE